jgi:hypothetical protein
MADMPLLGLNVINAKPFARVRWGVAWGLVFAMACCSVALLQLLLQGPAFFAAKHISLSGLFSAYVLGCGTGGAAVGLLVPVARTVPGSMAVGFLAVLPIGVAIQLGTLDGPWKLVNTFVVVIGSLGIGMPVGAFYRDLFAPALPRDVDPH